MQILFLSPNLSEYGGAFYQWDVYEELEERFDLIAYGPGFDNYDERDSIDDILEKIDRDPDLVCLGHGWLGDEPEEPVNRNTALNLQAADIPTVLILNKEYRNFDKKIEFAKKNEIDLVFTHHHKAAEWSEKYGLEFIFWPFAVNSDRFKDYGESKQYDFTFSGILRNPDSEVPQTDLRIRVQQHLFYTFDEIWVYPKREYMDYNIFWNARATSRLPQLINRVLHGKNRLPDDEYKKLLNRSKIGFNTLSPADLVGTRYFETMASKTLAFCQNSPIYENHNLFQPGEHCVVFENDLSDFDEKLRYYLENDEERREIAKKGHKHVMEHHTWNERIEQFANEVRQNLF